MIHERGEGGVNFIAVIAILIFLAFIFSGFFKDERVLWDSFNIKSLLRLPCGLTVQKPDSNTKIVFPVKVSGYINQCGWMYGGTPGGYAIAGTAQVFDDMGMPITKPSDLVVPNTTDGYPMYFGNDLMLLTPPSTDMGKIVFVSTTGLVYAVPVQF